MTKVYLWAFVNFKQNKLARFLLIAEFIYNNTKDIDIGQTHFQFNYGFYSKVLYKKDIDSQSKSKPTNKLVIKLKKLTNIYRENL